MRKSLIPGITSKVPNLFIATTPNITPNQFCFRSSRTCRIFVLSSISRTAASTNQQIFIYCGMSGFTFSLLNNPVIWVQETGLPFSWSKCFYSSVANLISTVPAHFLLQGRFLCFTLDVDTFQFVIGLVVSIYNF